MRRGRERGWIFDLGICSHGVSQKLGGIEVKNRESYEGVLAELLFKGFSGSLAKGQTAFSNRVLVGRLAGDAENEEKDACYSDPYTPYTPFHYLKELQLLLDAMTYDDLFNASSFFSNCPCPSLEKLFLEPDPRYVPAYAYDDDSSKQLQEPFDYNFDLLKTIKIKGFRGLENEIRFVKFLLEKAVVLESLVLITPHESHPEGSSNVARSELTRMPGDVLRKLLLLLPKASSHAKIVLSEQDDSGLSPTHTNIYPPSY